MKKYLFISGLSVLLILFSMNSISQTEDTENFDLGVPVTLNEEPQLNTSDTEYFDLAVSVTLNEEPQSSEDTEYFDLAVDVILEGQPPPTPPQGGNDTEYFDLAVNVTSGATDKSPNADFEYTVSGLAVSFRDTSTTSVGTQIVSWNWSFGDGNYSSQQNPNHTYKKAGLYTVNLTVINNYGLNDTTSKMITVMEAIQVETIKTAWNTFFGKIPRYVVDVDSLMFGRIGIASNITYDYWLWKNDKTVTRVDIYGVNKSKQTGWILKHYDWIKLNAEKVDEIKIKNTTYYIWEIKDYDEIKDNYTVIVIIPNPTFLDSEWWLEYTKSSKI